MKISIVSTAYPLRGGIAQYTGILHNRLREGGNDVQVVTFKRQYPAWLFPGKTQLETSDDASVKIPSLPIVDSIGPHTWFRAAKTIKAFQPDLLVFKYWMPFFAPCFGCLARRVKKNAETKVCYICDNVIPHERRLGDIALTRYALRAGDFFVVQSQIVEKELLSLIPDARYKLVPHPVYDVYGDLLDKSESRDRLGLDGERVILFFGYVRAYKGLDLLLRAMPEILQQLDVKLLIVGEFYEHEKKYRKLVDEFNLQANVRIYADFIPNEQVNVFFSAADVVVLPYKSATQSGIVQMAYHFNKPCIVTDVGGLAEVVLDDRTGFVVQPESPQAIAGAVVRFYRDGSEEAFSAAVREEKKRYSWNNLVDTIISVAE
jgi:glycosyltransferase involved in cell wall biosynthesis